MTLPGVLPVVCPAAPWSMTPTTTSPAPRPGWDPRHYEALIDVLVARIARAEDKPEQAVRHSLPLPPAPPIYPLPGRNA